MELQLCVIIKSYYFPIINQQLLNNEVIIYINNFPLWLIVLLTDKIYKTTSLTWKLDNYEKRNLLSYLWAKLH